MRVLLFITVCFITLPWVSIPAFSQASAEVVVPNADRAAEVFIQANQAYRRADYEEARNLYRALVLSGYGRGEVWYNLGNTEFRLEQLGQSLAAYRHAERSLPRDANLKYNIALIKELGTDQIEEDTRYSFLRNILFWHYRLNLREGFRLFTVAYIAVWVFLSIRWFGRLRWATTCAVILLLAAAVVGASLVLNHRAQSYPHRAAVIVPEAPVLSGYLESSQQLFSLHDGAEASVEEIQDEWALISLPDGNRGWIRRDVVELY